MKKLIKSITRIGALLIVIHDTYTTTIHSWITGQYAGFTWIGIIIFTIALLYTVSELDKCME